MRISYLVLLILFGTYLFVRWRNRLLLLRIFRGIIIRVLEGRIILLLWRIFGGIIIGVLEGRIIRGLNLGWGSTSIFLNDFLGRILVAWSLRILDGGYTSRSFNTFRGIVLIICWISEGGLTGYGNCCSSFNSFRAGILVSIVLDICNWSCNRASFYLFIIGRCTLGFA